MYSDLFSASSVQDLMAVLPSLPYAIWETFYVTVLSTLLSLVLGLPLGVLLVAGEKNGVLPLPRWLLQVLNVIINLLRSVPFLILMIMVFPLSRLIIGTAVGTTATIVPLVVAAFPFVARLVESSLREVDPNIIEAAQSMGATPLQIICKVMIPESVPSLIQNVTIALTTILGLLRHERYHRRRRSGQDRHRLRLLSLQVSGDAGGGGDPDPAGAVVPESGYVAGPPQR